MKFFFSATIASSMISSASPALASSMYNAKAFFPSCATADAFGRQILKLANLRTEMLDFIGKGKIRYEDPTDGNYRNEEALAVLVNVQIEVAKVEQLTLISLSELERETQKCEEAIKKSHASSAAQSQSTK